MYTPMKMLSLVLMVAAALIILSGGTSSTTSEGANTYTISGAAGQTWANMPALLNDGDTLILNASVGSPDSDIVIRIAANANVTIIGDASVTFERVHIAESASDTTAHNVNISNLKIKNDSGMPGYAHVRGVLNLTGSNSIHGDNYPGIYSPDFPLVIASSSGGSLTASTSSVDGIQASSVDIRGSAHVVVNNTFGSYAFGAVKMLGPSPKITVASGASLDISSSCYGIKQDEAGGLVIECNGTINTSGRVGGIINQGVLTITGTGKLTATSPSVIPIYSQSIEIIGAEVEAVGVNAQGLNVHSGYNVALTDGATLKVTGGVKSYSSDMSGESGYVLDPGTTLTLTNSYPGPESVKFYRGLIGNNWMLSGGAYIGMISGSNSGPDIIVIAPGGTGTISILSYPEIRPPETLALTEGYTAASTGVFTIKGQPAPTVTKTSGDSLITWNNTTKTLDVAAGLTAGNYLVGLTASNGDGPDVSIVYMVKVYPAASSSASAVQAASATIDPITSGTGTFTPTAVGLGGEAPAADSGDDNTILMAAVITAALASIAGAAFVLFRTKP